MSTFKVSTDSKTIWKQLVPIAVSMSVPQIQQFVNTVFLGQYSTHAQSVIGIAGIYYLFILSVCIGMNSGMLVLFSRFNGSGNSAQISKNLNNIWWLSSIVGISVMILGLMIYYFCFRYYIHDSSIESDVKEFLLLRSPALPFFTLLSILHSFFISIGRSKLILKITLYGALINVIFDYFLIFGIGFFPEMGVQGTALSSLLSEIVMCLVSVYYLYSYGFMQEFQVKPFHSLNWTLSFQQMKICLPLILQYMITLGGWLVFFTLIEHMGPVYLASSQIIRAAMGLSGICIWSFGSLANSFTSNLLGQGQKDNVISMLWKITSLSLRLVSIFSILYIFFPNFIMNFLSTDAEVIQVSIPALQILGFSILLMSIAAIFFNGVIGTGKVMYSIIVETVAVAIYLGYLFTVMVNHPGDMVWTWCSEFVYWAVILSASILFFRSDYFRTTKFEAEKL